MQPVPPTHSDAPEAPAEKRAADDNETALRRAVTHCGIHVTRRGRSLPYGGNTVSRELDALRRNLDSKPGALLSSQYAYPNRYTRWDVGFVDPLLTLGGRGLRFELRAERPEGEALMALLLPGLRALSSACDSFVVAGSTLRGTLRPDAMPSRPEETRTRRPTTLGVVRAVREALALPDEPYLGLYGAFGYDLVFQLEAFPQLHPRPDDRDLVLYLPDRLLVVDHERRTAHRFDYGFSAGQGTHDRAGGDPLDPSADPVALGGKALAAPQVPPVGSHGGRPGPTHDRPLERSRKHPGEDAQATPDQVGETCGLGVTSEFAPAAFAAVVEAARGAFGRGDLFEVTVGQRFSVRTEAKPSAVQACLAEENPAPYGFLVNLGAEGHLVGASPEMFVRVRGSRVETCPIAGTIARGADALADAQQVLTLLSSHKDEAELTMCTDVDRNDKARICEPGSVRVLGRRQIELYSRLIHTVDHIEGQLREGYDALDALATHCWAVTVTGAPKLDAMRFIEEHERSPRGFYGGAVGQVGLDGSLNTGLTLRTVHIRDGVASVRAGATLLHASDPAAEAAECQLKASALLAALARAGSSQDRPAGAGATATGGTQATAAHAEVRRRHRGKVLLADHRDSFVHTLADYFRQLGMAVTTLRAGPATEHAGLDGYELVVLSPGPGSPRDFGTAAMLDRCVAAKRPVFGVCLGMQAMVEYAGGALETLRIPRHGTASPLLTYDDALFDGIRHSDLRVGRYHSLYARPDAMPDALEVLAVSDDDCVMACRHRELPFLGVQFHPESILSATEQLGLRLLDNVLAELL